MGGYAKGNNLSEKEKLFFHFVPRCQIWKLWPWQLFRTGKFFWSFLTIKSLRQIRLSNQDHLDHSLSSSFSCRLSSPCGLSLPLSSSCVLHITPTPILSLYSLWPLSLSLSILLCVHKSTHTPCLFRSLFLVYTIQTLSQCVLHYVGTLSLSLTDCLLHTKNTSRSSTRCIPHTHTHSLSYSFFVYCSGQHTLSPLSQSHSLSLSFCSSSVHTNTQFHSYWHWHIWMDTPLILLQVCCPCHRVGLSMLVWLRRGREGEIYIFVFMSQRGDNKGNVWMRVTLRLLLY